MGIARALVLLAAVLCAGGAVLLCVAMPAFGSAILDRPDRVSAAVLGSALLALVVVVFALGASLLAVRGRTVAGVVARGCGMLLAGILVGLTVLLVLISRTA